MASSYCQLLLIGKQKKQLRIAGKLAPFWCFSSSASCPIIISTNPRTTSTPLLAPRWLRNKMELVEFNSRRLHFLSAYTSTLGGGYFLCKHVKVAWRLACRQQAIALALEDYTSAGQCRVHLTYILMQMGRLKEARKRLTWEEAYAKHRGLDRLSSIVFAAQVYLAKIEAKKHELKLPAPPSMEADDLRRQRFVRIEY